GSSRGRTAASPTSTSAPRERRSAVPSAERRRPAADANPAPTRGRPICGRPRTRSTTPASCRWRRASSSSDPLPRRPPAAGLLPYRPPAAGLLPYRPPAARSRAGSDMASLNIAYSSPPLIERAAPWRAGPIAAPASCVGKAVGSCSFPALPSVVDELSDETEHGQRREDTQPEDPLAVT